MKIFLSSSPESAQTLLERVLRDFYGILCPKFIKNEYGKPYLEGFSLFFSLSHSGTMTAIAVHDREIGLDIEQKRAKKVENIQRNLTNAEKNEDFFKVWTAKEAYVKFRGVSLARLYRKLEYKNGALYEQNAPVAAAFFHTETEGCTLTVCTAEKSAEQVELIYLH